MLHVLHVNYAESRTAKAEPDERDKDTLWRACWVWNSGRCCPLKRHVTRRCVARFDMSWQDRRQISGRARKIIRHMLGEEALAAILAGDRKLVEALSEVVANL